MFVDPVNDIAVLAAPDNQAFPNAALALDEWIETLPVLRVGKSVPVSNEGPLCVARGRLLSLDREWFDCDLCYVSNKWHTGRLRPDPPGHPVVTTTALCVSGSKRGLAGAAQPMQGRDSDATFVAFERRLDRCERVVAPHEMQWDTDGDVRQRSGESLRRPRGSSRMNISHRRERLRAVHHPPRFPSLAGFRTPAG
jgi:hypothetical protein